METMHNCRVRVRGVAMAQQGPDPLIAEALEHFGGRRRFRPGTLRTFKTVLTEMSAVLEGRPLWTATRADVLVWHGQQDKRGNSAGTVIRKQGALSTFYKWLLEQERIVKDPTVAMVRPKQPKRLPVHLTPAQVERLFSVLSWDTDDHARQLVAVKALYYTGMRAAELLGLNVEDWDRQAGTLRAVGKGDKERVLVVVPALAEVLERWLTNYHPTGAGPLLCFPSGRRYTYQPLRVSVKRAMRAAGVPDMTAHKLRHTHATTLLHKGVPLEEIQVLLGHSQIQTTLVYAHVRISDNTRQALANLL